MGRRAWIPARDKQKDSIRIRCSKLFKTAAERRAEELGKSLSDHIRELIQADMQGNG